MPSEYAQHNGGEDELRAERRGQHPYQVTGEGPDLVVVPGFVSHLEMDWTEPALARFLEQLSTFCRLIRLDKRGTGLSDPVPGVATLEERMEDVHVVMDAAGSERATLFGYSEGGPMSASSRRPIRSGPRA